MCGANSVSTSSFVKDGAAPDIHPGLNTADGMIDLIERLLSTGDREGAVVLMQDRDKLNVRHGRNTAVPLPAVSIDVPAGPVSTFTRAEIEQKLQLILSLIPTRKIEAIKEVRALTDMGLKASKDWVEGIYVATGVRALAPPPAPIVPQDPLKRDRFIVLRRTAGNSDFERYTTEDRASWAKSTALDLTSTSEPNTEILVVEVLGRSKFTFEMLDAF